MFNNKLISKGKTILVSVAAFTFILISSASVFAQTKTADKTSTQTDSVYYTCSMHPEVHMDKAGKCEKCGMNLIKNTELTAGDKNQKMKMPCMMMGGTGMDEKENAKPNNTVKQGVLAYECPMHCEGDKTYDKPGSCPKCGMNLKKKTE
jgi:uncharacterized paraquat-inducible protein A